MKCAWKEKENKEEKENQDEEKKVITQNDLLATTRTDLVDDDDDENAENESTEWMTNQLKFVKHFEVISQYVMNSRILFEMVHLNQV